MLFCVRDISWLRKAFYLTFSLIVFIWFFSLCAFCFWNQVLVWMAYKISLRPFFDVYKCKWQSLLPHFSYLFIYLGGKLDFLNGIVGCQWWMLCFYFHFFSFCFPSRGLRKKNTTKTTTTIITRKFKMPANSLFCSLSKAI